MKRFIICALTFLSLVPILALIHSFLVGTQQYIEAIQVALIGAAFISMWLAFVKLDVFTKLIALDIMETISNSADNNLKTRK